MLSTHRGATTPAPREQIAMRRLLWVSPLAALAALATTAAVRAVAMTRFEIATEFAPLGPEAVAGATVLAVAGAVMVFAVLGPFVRRSAAMFLSAAVGLLLSMLPDIESLTASGLPGASPQSVGTLLLLRIVAVVVGVGLLARLAQTRGDAAAPTRGVDAANEPQAPGNQAQPPQHIIMLVTHDAMLAGWLQPSLVQAGFTVRVAGDGQQAISMSTQQRPDLLLIARQLSDGDGLDLGRLLRSQLHVPIVIIAARISQDDMVAALERGADDVLTEGCSAPEITARVRTILRRTSPPDGYRAAVVTAVGRS